MNLVLSAVVFGDITLFTAGITGHLLAVIN
jgi:hypothetical protein